MVALIYTRWTGKYTTSRGSGKYKFSLKTPLCCLSFAVTAISVLQETGLCYQQSRYFAFTTYKEIYIWIPNFVLLLGPQSQNILLWHVDCMYVFWWKGSSRLKNTTQSLSLPLPPVLGCWDQSVWAAVSCWAWVRGSLLHFVIKSYWWTINAQNFKHVTGLHNEITVKSTPPLVWSISIG